MSAASFLGISGLVFASGFDGLIYSIGFLVGWPIVLFLIAERLRNLGKFTFADVAAFRLAPDADPHPVGDRHAGRGGLLPDRADGRRRQADPAAVRPRLLYAVVIVGVLMIVYVAFGGMMATTWVQIIKACLLLAGATFMALHGAVRTSASAPRRCSPRPSEIHPKGDAIMAPGELVTDPISAISLGLALMFGTAGLPHILMRFFTVSDAKAARKSVFYATGFIGYFYILTFIIGFGAITFLLTDPSYFNAGADGVIQQGHGPDRRHQHGGDPSRERGRRQPVPRLHLGGGLRHHPRGGRRPDARRRLGRQPRPLRRGDRHGPRHRAEGGQVSKIAAVVLGIVAIILGNVFENQNVAFMVGLAFAVAASCNFPVLLMSMFWKGLTTRGALVGGFLGLISAVAHGGAVQGGVGADRSASQRLGVFPYDNPALFSMTIAFVGIWLFSKLDSSRGPSASRPPSTRSTCARRPGIGAAAAHAH